MYSKRQYLSKLQTEYRKANKEKKTLILNEYIKNTGHNRKYVIRQLNCNTLLRSPVRTQKKAPCKYKGKVIDSLVKLHQIFDCPCGQRFRACLDKTVLSSSYRIESPPNHGNSNHVFSRIS